ERHERRGLQPSRVQLRARRSVETADVTAGEWDAREPEPEDHRNRNTQVIPSRVIVAGPNGRVALRTCIRRPRDDEWPALGTKAAKSLECGARHQRPILVVVLEVGSRVAVPLELHDVRDRLTTKGGRLVHVVPHAADSDID